MAEKRFSLIDFYERRARRILPSLFVVLAFTTIAAAMTLFPADFKRYGQSLFATGAFISNIYFYLTSDYFAPATEHLPLVHTWSLAVEEQFYIFFPILLLIFSSRSVNAKFSVVLFLSACSLILAHTMVGVDASAAFYLLPTRAWELGAGALCAIWLMKRERPQNDIFASAGLVMILVSILAFDKSFPTPSLYTAVPVIGASLIIVFGTTRGLSGLILTWRPMVWIGLVSYSAYLWHQPLFSLTREASGIEPPVVAMLILCGLTFLFAYLSWRFVEQPFRRGGRGIFPTRPVIFAASAVGLAAMVAIGFTVHSANGFPQRINQQLTTILAAAQDRSPQTNTCLVTIDARAIPDMRSDNCLWPSSRDRSNGLVVLVGDSHANALSGVLSQQLPAAGYDFLQLTVRGCAPFPGFRKDASNRDCHSANLAIAAHLDEIAPYRIIVAWRGTSMFAEQFDNGEGGVDLQPYAGMDLQEDYYPDLRTEDQITQVLSIFRRGLNRLAAYGPLLIIGPIPEAGWNVPNTYARFVQWRGATDLSTSRAAFDRRHTDTFTILNEFETAGQQVLYPHRILCNAERCMNAVDETIYYFDDDHLSNEGARLMLPSIIEALADGAYAER